MKNILTKIITVYVIVAAIAILFKVGDNLLASASTNNSADQCGVNNGWIWNGSQCVSTCDQNHPWDPNQQKCSNGYNYVYNYNYGYGTNCAAAYGSNFYFNGTNCVQMIPGQNATYYGNPYSGGVTNPVYTSGQSVNNNYVYGVPNYTNTNYVSTSCGNSCYQNPAPRVNTTYYEYTITTTTSNPGGTPIYLGNNGCYNGCSYNNYNYNYNYGYDYNYYNYNNYNYGNYYNDGFYCDTGYTNVGYYDMYGRYHY